MTRYMNLELSGNDKGDDQKGNIFMLPLIMLLLLPHYSIYNIEGKIELNQKMPYACTLSKDYISRIYMVIKLNFQRMLKG